MILFLCFLGVRDNIYIALSNSDVPKVRIKYYSIYCDVSLYGTIVYRITGELVVSLCPTSAMPEASVSPGPCRSGNSELTLLGVGKLGKKTVIMSTNQKLAIKVC